MSKLVLCRVCLSHDVRMYSMGNTRYQEMYEKQTGAKLVTGGGRPDMVCYICNSQLQRFSKFLQMSQKAEKYLYEMNCYGIELTHENVACISSALCNLSVNTAFSMTVSDITENSDADVTNNDNNETGDPDRSIEDVAVKIESIDYEEFNLEDSVEISDDDRSTPIPLMISEAVGDFNDSNHLTVEIELPAMSTQISEDIDFDSDNHTVEIESQPNQNEEFNYESTEYKLANVSVSLQRMPITRSQLKRKEPKTLNRFYSCKQCARRFRTVENLKTHRKSVHRPRRNVCEICGKTFKKTQDMRKHVKRIHTLEPPHACPLCDRKFKHRSMFHVHMRTHTGEKPFECTLCEKTFNDKSNCRKHMKTHSGRTTRHACFMCDQTFSQKSRLKEHAIEHIL